MEALIAPLRSHLSRLSKELSEHQRLLQELRSLRDTDAQALVEKGQEVDSLRHEVERLAGEVQVLRGVIEEGLEERRSMREQQSREQDDESDDGLPDRTQAQIPETSIRQVDPEEGVSESEEDATPSSIRSSPTPSRHRPDVDKTFRTDYATLGSSQIPGAADSRPFIGEDELERISVELQERRSERSASSSHSPDHSRVSNASSRLHSRVGSPHGSVLGDRPTNPSRRNNGVAANNGVEPKPSPPVASTSYGPTGGVSPRAQSPIPSSAPRPDAPTPAHALRKSRPAPAHDTQSERARSHERRSQRAASPAESQTPFPQIRGAHLEQLFFSAPPHDVQTCSVCHRRSRRHRVHSDGHGRGQEEPTRFQRYRTTVEDAESDVEREQRHPWFGVEAKGKQPKREQELRGTEDAKREKLPPQTVLARVLRELEDDFTHYKRFVLAARTEI